MSHTQVSPPPPYQTCLNDMRSLLYIYVLLNIKRMEDNILAQQQWTLLHVQRLQQLESTFFVTFEWQMSTMKMNTHETMWMITVVCLLMTMTTKWHSVHKKNQQGAETAAIQPTAALSTGGSDLNLMCNIKVCICIRKRGHPRT